MGGRDTKFVWNVYFGGPPAERATDPANRQGVDARRHLTEQWGVGHPRVVERGLRRLVVSVAWNNTEQEEDLMATTVRKIMTADPIILSNTSAVTDAAKRMREADVGDVLVERDGQLCGIVTDRDIVVRAIADERDPSATTLGDICSQELYAVAPDDDVDEVVKTMRAQAIRRVPVVDNDTAVGILSIGDLAVRRDPDSALGDISEAPSND